MVPEFRAELDCIQCEQKNENKKYDNSTLTKFNQPLAFAAQSFHRARAHSRMVCAFAGGSSG
jgi:hypothetical protein